MEEEMMIEPLCTETKNEIRDLGAKVIALKDHSVFKDEQSFDNQHGEMIANIMLSYRHMEDARMRIGKVMQQIQGGVSIFDKQEKG